MLPSEIECQLCDENDYVRECLQMKQAKRLLSQKLVLRVILRHRLEPEPQITQSQHSKEMALHSLMKPNSRKYK